MNVKVIYNPLLRKTADKVTVFDAKLEKTANEMLKTMKGHSGIGLAANQVGVDKRLIVMGYEKKDDKDEMPNIPFIKLCNPKVVKFSKEKDTSTEGCLSIPGLELLVERSVGVVVEAQDLAGNKVTVKARGWFARVLQHEIDHIDGILFTDKVKNYRKLTNYKFSRIVFVGSDDFSVTHLTALVEAGLNVVAVITETDKRAGRGKEIKSSVVKEYAKTNSIAVFQPEDTDNLTGIVKEIKADLIVLASYGKILPQEALDAPTFGAINVHPSLLPKYRGATPIQSAIISGENETGVTIMSMSKTVDAGEIISQEKLKILEDETSPMLRSRLAKLGKKLLIEAIPEYLSGRARLLAQDSSKKTLTKRFKKEDGEINWEEPAEKIVRKIRALQPWPSTYTFLGDKRLKIVSAYYRDGKVLPLTVQIEGKKRISWEEFSANNNERLTRESWYGKITW